MMTTLLFLTARSERHQQAARRSIPGQVDDIRFLYEASREEVLAAIPEADFLISERACVIDREMIHTGQRLRLIQRLGRLTYDIDLDAAREVGVPVCNYPLPGAMAVAEHLIWQILALLRRAHDGESAIRNPSGIQTSRATDENTFAPNWSQRRGLRVLNGLTVGILGFGEIGMEVARRLEPFGCRLFYHKRSPLPGDVEAGLGIGYRVFDDLVAESDMLCNLLPFSRQTAGVLSAQALARMPQNSYLVSCGSGGVIDETALARAVESGHLAGAALDTFGWEPILPDNPLLPLAHNPAQNVVLTPHTAFLGVTAQRVEEFANIRRLLAGESLGNQVV
ncbi:MAG TPA: NAD(P)-dependent oxidoreductase [Caldilineaceae bacterium]|nr:NAD(P)-dependent oxidoreductase [Caldilineaceae bacterium]